MIKNTLPETEYDLSDFNYDLPENYIAQTPLEPRDHSKLMVVHKSSGLIEHRHFYDIIDYLNPEDTLVLNNTRVIPARILGTRIHNDRASYDKNTPSSAPVELLLLKQRENLTWEALAGPGKRARKGDVLEFGSGILKAHIIDVLEEGIRLVRFEITNDSDNIYTVLEKIGNMPLPPYITKKLENGERYQTVYSKIKGSAAAPTAGLHFTEELLDRIREKGVSIVSVLLHVGLGTFRPVSESKISDHVMHSEYIKVTEEASELINARKRAGGRTIAVGTTSCRVLESASDDDGTVRPVEDETGIFIYPGYRFKCVDSLITNFHLPESTLLMLVSAFSGRDLIFKAYKEAIENEYRFFSFGDAMLLL